MTTEELDALERLHAAATAGPWFHGRAGNANVVRYIGDDVTPVATTSEVNAATIAAEHNALPSLLALARASQWQDIESFDEHTPTPDRHEYLVSDGKAVWAAWFDYDRREWHETNHHHTDYWGNPLYGLTLIRDWPLPPATAQRGPD